MESRLYVKPLFYSFLLTDNFLALFFFLKRGKRGSEIKYSPLLAKVKVKGLLLMGLLDWVESLKS